VVAYTTSPAVGAEIAEIVWVVPLLTGVQIEAAPAGACGHQADDHDGDGNTNR